jgi:hypothetical protein
VIWRVTLEVYRFSYLACCSSRHIFAEFKIQELGLKVVDAYRNSFSLAHLGAVHKP